MKQLRGESELNQCELYQSRIVCMRTSKWELIYRSHKKGINTKDTFGLWCVRGGVFVTDDVTSNCSKTGKWKIYLKNARMQDLFIEFVRFTKISVIKDVVPSAKKKKKNYIYIYKFSQNTIKMSTFLAAVHIRYLA